VAKLKIEVVETPKTISLRAFVGRETKEKERE